MKTYIHIVGTPPPPAPPPLIKGWGGGGVQDLPKIKSLGGGAKFFARIGGLT